MLFITIFMPLSSSFQIDLIETKSNKCLYNIFPKPTEFIIKPDMGSIRIEMKEDGQGSDCDEYPYCFDVDKSNFNKTTVEMFVPHKLAIFPVMCPKIEVVFADFREEHPSYKIVVVFLASGNQYSESEIVLSIGVDEKFHGEEKIPLEFNGGYSPLPKIDTTYHPTIKIYKEGYDKLFHSNLRYVAVTDLIVNVTIKNPLVKYQPLLKIFNNKFDNNLINLFSNIKLLDIQ